jgi:mRNA-degrading endonuclease toxin of MazEF toxin-antitoxin module
MKNKVEKINVFLEKIKNDINESLIWDFLDWFYEKLNLHFITENNDFYVQKWDIFYVNFWKNIGNELNKIRPALVYSKKFFNKGWTIIVIPLKSYKWLFRKDIYLFVEKSEMNQLKKDSIVDMSGIRQISKKRLKWYIWKMNQNELEKIDKRMKSIFWIK